MANAMQGIMALPGAPGMMDRGSAVPPPGPMAGGLDPSLIDPKATQYARSNPDEFGQDIVDSLESADPALVYELRSTLAGMNLPNEVVDALLVMIDMIMQDPGNYAENRQMFIDEGVPEEILPPNFDPIFLTGLQMALSETKRSAAPQRFARGGIVELKPIAKAMAQMGRNGDTMLAHITPGEARLLRVMGGSGTTNPYTGLPEFFLKKLAKAAVGVVGGAVKGVAKAVGSVVKGAADVVKAVVKPVANVVKKIAQNPIGRIALTIAATVALGPAGLTTAGVAGSMGLSGAVALGVNTALASTAVNLASGQSLKESLKGGALSGLTAGVISSAFPSTLPQAYRGVAPGAVAAPVSVADYGASVDALDAYNASGAAIAPDVSSGIPVAGAAPTTVTPIAGATGLESANVIQPPSVSPITAPAVAGPEMAIAPPQVAPIEVPPPGYGPFGAPADVVAAPASEIPGAAGAVTSPAPAAAAPTGVAPAAEIPVASPTTAVDEYNVLYGGIKGAPEAMYQAPPSLLDKGIGAIKDVYNEYISPSRASAAGSGAIVKYAPMAALGTAALAASGAFTPKQPPPPGIVDQTYMRGGAEPIPVNLGDVRTVTAPDIGYGSTSFYNIGSGYNPAMGGFGPPQFTVRRPEDYLDLSFLNQRYAKGGIASLDKPRTYPRKTGAINGPGTETSDSIPALLSDGEFVFTAKAVRGAGGGSRRAGAKRMYAMMKALEKKANG